MINLKGYGSLAVTRHLEPLLQLTFRLFCSDGADTFAVNKFLCRVFQSPPDTSKSMTSINVEQTANELDLKEEVKL